MKIIFTPHFKRRLKKLIKKQPEAEVLFMSAISLLQKNINAPSLNVHKLSGRLKDAWSFYLTYELRIVFEKENNLIILTNIGSHDEVY